MSGKYTWKLILTLAVMAWTLLNLVPLQDTPFEDYLRKEAVRSPEFDALLDKAAARVSAGESPSHFVAIKQIATEEAIDVSKFFPGIKLEESLVNLNKRNSILLDELLRRSKGALQLGLDLKGGVAFTLEVDSPVGVSASEDQREEELSKAIEIIGQRVDAFGVSEPIIRPVGENRIEVQLAGLSTRDNPEVVNELKKPARLEFKLVHPVARPDSTPEAPPGYEVMELEQERGNEVFVERLFIKRIPEMTGDAIERAGPSVDEYGKFRVVLSFTGEGADRFAEVTRELSGNGTRVGRLAIVLDGVLYSAPTVRQEIRGGNAEITGSFTQREAVELSNVLNNPLDVPLRVIEMSEVGPSLAKDSVDSGRKAFIWGLAITAIFIVVYYTSAGLMAVVAMACNVLIILGVMASDLVGATLSLPGIAGLVLTLGMSVDSNILIFERMREELATGKNLRAALEAGFEKAFSAILDANVTTLITGVVMIGFGTGPVKGFGVVLTIGIFSTMFAALVISRLLIEVLVYTNAVKSIKMLSAIGATNIDFMRYARPAFLTSWAIVVIGVVVVIVKGSSIYGIDFTGGDELTLTYEQQVDVAEVRSSATRAGLREVTPVYQQLIGSDEEVLKIQAPFDQGAALLSQLQQDHPAAGFTLVGESRIGPSVSSQIQLNALLAILLSLVGILVYVAFRFEMGYGIGAVVATVHDVLMTIGIFVLFDRQFNATMVGAILLIAGYSINDTIVVFDRIREELTLNPNAKLRDIINLALNRTLARTIITGGTTFFTSLALFLVAGGAVNDLALTLIIGIIVGTFSSIFIASPVFFWWHKGDRKHVEASHDIAPKYEWSASSRATE
ncbi:protein translocase subunit SecD [Opitutales bacterium ASA1]|uniref:protein translocase subunit SecD n=1 Tax=Congregicoccus parvus TaxID=3081749 RepID=UPI002B2BFAE9|nr:protein translocase subunit SecD [Opitutales bacterium ASA1]